MTINPSDRPVLKLAQRAPTTVLGPWSCRRLRTLAVLLLMGVGAVPAAMAAPPSRPQQLTSPDQVPEGLAKSDWANIRAAYEAGRHAFQPTPTGWQARNPGQQWTTTFDRRGFVATPKTGGWTWGLELQGYGFGAHQQTIAGTPAVQAEGSRLTYQWDSAVQEWFINDQRGLEHGFTVSTRPAADPAALTAPNAQPTSLSFLLAVRGGLRPHVTPDALGVEFRDAAGANVLNYAGLKVWDADGKSLTSRFELADSSPAAPGTPHAVRLLVDERGARYPITIDPIAQQAYLKASNNGPASANEYFGYSVAVSGDTVAVGAYREDSSTTGVASTPDESATDAGAAYVFVRSGTTWTQQAYLKAHQVTAGDNFGYSVAVSGDTVVVGAYQEDSSTTGVASTPDELASGSGAAYVFVRSGTTWTQQAYLKASQVTTSDNFGYSVAVSGDTVVVGAINEDSGTTGVDSTPNESAQASGAAYVFVRSGTTWTQQAYLKASQVTTSDNFGYSVAVSGDTVVVGATNEDSSTTGVDSTPNESATDAGAAYVFVRSGTTWTQQAYLKAQQVTANDRFGVAVAVSGDTVVVGASNEDSSTTGVNSTPNEISINAGAAYVFVRSGSTWTQQAYIKASNTPSGPGANDQFGYSVATSGDTVVVGAPYEDSSATGVNSTPNESATDAGAAYVFVRSGTTWTQQAYLKAHQVTSSDSFGYSVAVSGDTVVVGAYQEDSSTTGVASTPDELASGSGAAYVFVRSGTTWAQQAYLKAQQVSVDDGFGVSVALSGDTVVVGAHQEDSSTTGVNSAPDESATDAGAAYVFVRSGTTWNQQAYLKAQQVTADDRFGIAVAVSGNTVAVGAYQEDSSTTGVASTPDESASNTGAAYVFVRSGTTWTQQAYLKAHQVSANDYFGGSVAVSGDTVVVGAFWEDSSTMGVNTTPNESATNAGAAYVFMRSGTMWTQQAYLKAHQVTAGDQFGSSVAVSGDTVVVSATSEDSSTTGVNSTPNESASSAGAAYVFVRSVTAGGTTWAQQAYLKAHQVSSNDQFGQSVAVSGDTVVVGARIEDSSTTGVNSTPNELASNAGAAYVFTGLGVATVTAPTSASIVATSATLGGNVTSDGGATITATGIVYAPTATNNNPLIGGAGVTDLAGLATTGVFTVSASSLTAGTAYTYTAYATTSAGTVYSSTGIFTTAATSPVAPTGVTAVLGNTQATVSFTAPASDGGAAITSYTVTSTPGSLTATGASSPITITGLTNGTSYTFTVTATNSVGAGSASTASSAVTPVSAPTVTSPTSASVASTSATLGGDVTATGGASLTAVGVVYSVTSANNNPQLSGTGVTNLTGTAATEVFTVSATGLTAGTAYSYAAYATNSVGTTYSSVGTFTTTVPTPTLTFTTPSTASVAVGATQTNAVTSTLSGGSYGAITYTSSDTSKATVNASTGVVTGLAVGSTTITATQAAASGFNATTSTSYTLTVTIGTPTITAAPTATGITYGQTLASSTLSGGTANVAGTFTFTTTSTAPNAGTAAQGVTFTPTDTTNYTSITTTANVTVAKATPTLTWATPATITYGTALSATQLNATSSLAAGSITYSPASGTTPSAGTQTLTATFTPTDTANYNTATRTVSLVVGKATPTLTWATPSAITYGTALSATQLNATSSLAAGTITYSPASGTTPSAGTQTLTATFTPTDTTNYNTATGTVSLTVNKASPTITWASPSAITYGTALSATQLNASGSVTGAIVYSPASGTTPSAGTQTLTATFTPTDTANYNTATGTVSLVVGKATPNVTWATPSAITYGTTLSATQLNATSSLAAGAITYSPASGATPSAGTQTLTATFTPTDTSNYNTATGTVSLTVSKATPTLAWATPSAITYGTALSATQLNATSSLAAGTITYSPASGTTPSAGTQTLTATFTPTDTANYNIATGTVSLTVSKATPTLTWATPSAITYGTTLSATQLNATSSLAAGSITYSPASGTTPSAGTQTLTATFTPTDTANYNTATGTVSLTVNKATPTITWATPSTISYGTALSATQLNATANVAGSITYSPANGATPSAGTQTLTATFTPTDTTNYNPATGTVSLTVNKATPTITWATPSTISYGTALSATQLNATANVAGAITYSPASGAILSVGTQTLSASFTPADSANYNSASASVSLNVIVAVPGVPTAVSATTANGEATVTFTAPNFTGSAAISGYTIRATATDGSIVTVNAAGSPAKITGLTPGKSYRFTVTANNSAGSSESSTVTDALTISLVNQTISFAAPADRASNSGSFALSATASSGLPVTFTLVSGPGLLAGNVVDLTGATGPIKLRASQAGNATYAAAPEVEVTFAVTAGPTNVVFSQALGSGSRVPAAELGLVLPGNGQPGSLLVVSTLIPGLNGVITLGTTVSGGFIGTLVSSVAAAPLDARIQAAPVTYTVTGTLLNGVLTGTIAPLGLVFTAPVPLPTGPSAAAAGLYVTGALVQAAGTVSAVVGANNEVLVLIQSATVTTGGLTTLKPDTTFALAAPGNGLITGAVNPVTTAATATLTLPGSSPVAFSGLSTTTKRTDRLIGLASRAKVGTGESVLITGLAIGGSDSKRVLIRAGGPALAAFGLGSTLPNPTLKIYRGATLIAQNDDWNPADAAEMERLGIFAFPNGSKDASILTTLEPGSYTAHVSDLSGTGTGVALAEIYDASVNPTADYQRLVSIASRGTVSVGDGALIGGFVVVGNSPKTLLIRGIGPTLTSFGLVGALADPVLTIYDGGGEALANNAGWANSATIATAATEAGAFALTTGSRDAALLVTLKPGSYTAQVKAAQSASSGVALIEIYEVP